MSNEARPASNFIRNIISEDLKNGKHKTTITRFPPEPNGYLHIGHAKSICLNHGISLDNPGAKFHLRFDDTNPEKEEVEYIDSIKEDVAWLGADWGDDLYHSSDYFDFIYDCAIHLIKDGKAFVCDLNAEETREYRGTLKAPGKDSPYRNRSVEDNIDLFEKMKNGEFKEGEKCLRAKIDMSSSNINMRDPVIYRIRFSSHPRIGEKWCIYPIYDFTHPLSDALEHITHSICTLEFEDHRPLYNWFIENCPVPSTPRQIEFARLNIDYTILSKRKLLQLVTENHVEGWDDPRMPTISGVRRRGYTPKSIRTFMERIGVTKKDTCIDMSNLESCVRDDLNEISLRSMAVLKPIKVIIENMEAEETIDLDCPIHPQKPELGRRSIVFSKTIYIDSDDFMLNPEPGFHRLGPGREVRLRYGFVIQCKNVVTDDNGNIIELHCHYLSETRGGKRPEDGRKVKGIIHWVSEDDKASAEIRIYDRLFKIENPNSDNFLEHINKDSLEIIETAFVHKDILGAKAFDHFQFERIGFFSVDPILSSDGAPVFNRTVTLRDAWTKSKK
ncbi:MAG: glutamine--tRNA ligase/YqeY domain fusion protein [Bacteriovoracaceae bacterium]|nr:glutamine--tRNA ligase/YqeY domain fusion protein [Bacteriovoracaceae bacterium]